MWVHARKAHDAMNDQRKWICVDLHSLSAERKLDPVASAGGPSAAGSSPCPPAQQARVCTSRPGHEAPPFWGAGLLHSLLLSWVPALHTDQELQQLQRPSALAPAEKISQERKRLAWGKQLAEMYRGRAILSPWSSLQSLSGEMPWGSQPRPLCSLPHT